MALYGQRYALTRWPAILAVQLRVDAERKGPHRKPQDG